MTPDLRFMEFRLGQALYAIPLLSVKEVLQKPELTPVPNMPAHFEGMINLRGQILGIMNVSKRLSTAQAQSPALQALHPVVIVIEDQGVQVGMTVDEVTRVLQVKESQLSAAPLKKEDPAHKYVSSVIQIEKDLILSLNLYELLDLKSFQKLAESA